VVVAGDGVEPVGQDGLGGKLLGKVKFPLGRRSDIVHSPEDSEGWRD